MKKRFLPIGTVVMIKEAENPCMITGYCIYSKKIKEDAKLKLFEYAGCPYPMGVLDGNAAIAFNHEDIDKVLYLGFENDMYKDIDSKLNKNYDKIKKEFESGKLNFNNK